MVMPVGYSISGGAGGKAGDAYTTTNNSSGFSVGDFVFGSGQAKVTNDKQRQCIPCLIGFGVVALAAYIYWRRKK